MDKFHFTKTVGKKTVVTAQKLQSIVPIWPSYWVLQEWKHFFIKRTCKGQQQLPVPLTGKSAVFVFAQFTCQSCEAVQPEELGH